jgi:hypothetical protein
MSRANILDTIVEQKRREVALLPAHIPTVDEIKAVMSRRGRKRDFIGALKRQRKGDVGLIAEVNPQVSSGRILMR